VSLRIWLALACLAACGPGSYTEFRDELVTRSCDRDRRCGVIGATESCGVPEALALTAAGPLDVPSAISDGRLRFDARAAQDCLDAMASAPCDPAAAALHLRAKCHAVVRPNVATGGACDTDDECVGGHCVACRCFAWPPPGNACTRGAAGCDPTVEYCGGDPATCRLHKQAGDDCEEDDECAFPLVCRRVDKRIQCGNLSQLSDGKPCDGGVCGDDSYCAPSGRCAVRHGENAPCDSPAGCGARLACGQLGADAGVCKPWRDDGEACADGLCPASQTCVPGGGDPDLGFDGTCRGDAHRPAGPHDSCDTRACAAGLFCAVDKTCEFLRLLVGGCDPDDSGCAPGLVCNPDLRRCVGGAACAFPDGGSR
jgi:hypothetical protein